MRDELAHDGFLVGLAIDVLGFLIVERRAFRAVFAMLIKAQSILAEFIGRHEDDASLGAARFDMHPASGSGVALKRYVAEAIGKVTAPFQRFTHDMAEHLVHLGPSHGLFRIATGVVFVWAGIGIVHPGGKFACFHRLAVKVVNNDQILQHGELTGS